MYKSLLTTLADSYGSDKGFLVGDRHCYTFLYDILFSSMRGSAINIAELGLAFIEQNNSDLVNRVVSSPSVKMWLDYFPKGILYGFDISDFSHQLSDRFHFFRGDSGSIDSLNKFCDFMPDNMDIIIDDASHASFHQQLALRVLFNKVKPGGLYIIEDLHWQPDDLEISLPSVPKTELFLRGLCTGKKHCSAIWNEKDIEALQSLISSAVVVTGLEAPGRRYRNSIGIIQKRNFS